MKESNAEPVSAVKKFHVVDSIMGSGKSQGAIAYINEHPGWKFIVVTPYLAEVQRFIDCCTSHRFKEPTDKVASKSKSLRELLFRRENIVTTHALFFKQSEEIKELYTGYHLIIDEAPEKAITQIENLSDPETSFLYDSYIYLDEDKMAIWVGPKNYSGRFADVKAICDAGRARGYICEDEDGCGLFEVFPSDVFEAFDEVIFLTYLLDGQIFQKYLEIEKIDYDYWYVKKDRYGYALTPEYQPEEKANYLDMITIVNDEKLNAVGSGRYSLSKSWYSYVEEEKNRSLGNNLYNFFRHLTNSKKNERMWTTFTSYEDIIAQGRYQKNFIPCNMRATNEYKECTKLAYLVNRFMSPDYTILFSKYGLTINNEAFALSEMLQWVWRSAIREGKPIEIYVPSERMRNIFLGWLCYVSGVDTPNNQTSENIYNWLQETAEAKKLLADK